MAIRYSGDVEVRVSWEPRRRVYVGRITDPFQRMTVEVPYGRRTGGPEPRSSEAYDAAAVAILTKGEALARRRGGHLQIEASGGLVTVRRLFQAPCPTGAS